ncbi:globin domain-containing protein [Nocardia takedensis]
MSLAPGNDADLRPEHAEIVRATLPLVGAHVDEISTVFYRRLFQHHPDLERDLFNRADQADGDQPRALAASIAAFATHLVDPATPRPASMLARIAHKHASLGVTVDQYAVVHRHLFDAIVEVLGADTVTPQVATAWDHVYQLLATTLIEREIDLYSSTGTEPNDPFRPGLVTARVQDTPDVAIYTVESADAATPTPDFLPGQYISVRVTLADGARQIRQYSLVNAPGGGTLEFAVKRRQVRPPHPAGEVSTWLHDNLVPGDTVEFTHPFGHTTIDTEATTPLVLLSAGIGITPMIGILEHIAANSPRRPVTIAHADRSPTTHALRTRQRDLAERLPAATLALWYTQPTPGSRQGALDLTLLDLPADADYYLCGSPEFLRTMRRELRGIAVPDDHIDCEQFTPVDWRHLSA